MSQEIIDALCGGGRYEEEVEPPRREPQYINYIEKPLPDGWSRLWFCDIEKVIEEMKIRLKLSEEESVFLYGLTKNRLVPMLELTMFGDSIARYMGDNIKYTKDIEKLKLKIIAIKDILFAIKQGENSIEEKRKIREKVIESLVNDDSIASEDEEDFIKSVLNYVVYDKCADFVTVENTVTKIKSLISSWVEKPEKVQKPSQSQIPPRHLWKYYRR